MKRLFFGLLFLFIVPLVFGADLQFIAQDSDTQTIYVSCLNSGSFIASNATTIIYSSNTSIYLSETNMTLMNTGRFNISFKTPADQGDYLIVAKCTQLSDNTIKYNTGNFQIKNIDEAAGMSQLAIVFSLLGIIAFFVVYGHKLITTEEKDTKYLYKRLFGSIFFSFALLFVTILTFMLTKFAENKSYYAVLNGLFVIFGTALGVIASLGLLVFATLFIILLFSDLLGKK